jgi:hypothetical protein
MGSGEGIHIPRWLPSVEAEKGNMLLLPVPFVERRERHGRRSII